MVKGWGGIVGGSLFNSQWGQKFTYKEKKIWNVGMLNNREIDSFSLKGKDFNNMSYLVIYGRKSHADPKFSTLFPSFLFFQVQAIKTLYLYHNWPAWYQFVTATFCHANW